MSSSTAGLRVSAAHKDNTIITLNKYNFKQNCARPSENIDVCGTHLSGHVSHDDL